jgi:regulator of replication initiation timing
MKEWMERFEDSPLTTNERKVRQSMKTSLPPPPMKRSYQEELDELLAESRRNLGVSSREPYSPSRQVGSIESELNSQLMGLKKDYRKLEEKYQRLKEENSSLRRANDTLGATVADYKKKLFAKQKKQNVVKPVKNVFDSIKKWFYE